MKKLLLLAAAIVGFSSAYADVIKLDGAQTLVTDLVEGKQYLIFDASKITQGTNGADQDRYAFRYVNTTNDAILGDHSTKPTVDGVRYLKLADIDAYLWTVTGNSTDGWYFQNVATKKYIPMGNNYDGNMKVVADKPEKTYKFIESSETHKAFIVAQSDGNGDNAWDGRNNAIFSMTNWSKQSDTSNNHWYQFVEYDAATMTPDTSELQAELATGIAKLPALSTLTPFKDKTPGYYASADDENLDAYKAWVNQVTALTTATGATVMDLLEAIDDVKAAVAAGGPGVNTNLGVAEGKYKIFCRDNGFIYDANRADNHVMTSTQVGSTEYCSDPNSVGEDNHYWEVVADGDNYYIRNVGSQKYLVAPATQSAQQYWTLSETEHSAITIKTSALRGYPQVEILGNNVHMGITGGWANQTYVVSYYASNDVGSPFIFASELDVAKDALKAALDAKTSNIGTGVGKYSYDNDGATVIANAQNVYDNSAATVAELKAATTAVEAVTRSLNSVVPGRFYRLKGNNNYYLNNKEITIDGATRIQMQPTGDGNNGAKSVVYYSADGNLVSLLDGEVLGNFSDDARCFVMKDSGNAGVVTFEEGTQTGKYLIKVSGPAKNYYAFGGWTGANNHQYEVDRGEGSVTGDARYYWTIEELTPDSYLPLPVADGETAISFYLPCALKVRPDRMTGYTLEMNVGTTEANEPVSEVVKTATEEVMAANTVHYAELATSATISDGSVFLQIDSYPKAVGKNGESAITGKFYTFTKPADKSYFHAITTTGSDKFFSLNNDATTVKGFTGYIEMAAPSDHAKANGYKLVSEKTPTTGIEEIVAGGENGAKVIYDLQGRRVANASKGIFIINGVKTLVK